MAVDTTNKWEGGGSAVFAAASTQNLNIADASLASGFPLKSTESNKVVTYCFFLKLTVITQNAYIFSQGWGSNKGIVFCPNGGSSLAYIGWGYNTSVEYKNLSAVMVANKVYHVAICLDGANKFIKVRIYNITDSSWFYNNYITTTNALTLGTAPLNLGAKEDYTLGIDGNLDEFVVFNRILTDYEIDTIRAGNYTGPITNNFSADSACKALYRFESGALTTDSIGTNTLTLSASPPTADPNYREGASSAAFVRSSNQHGYVTDANLAAGFPLKNGDSTRQITVTCWVMAYTANAWQTIWSKRYFSTRCGPSLNLYSSGSTFCVSSGDGTGNNFDFNSGISCTLNQWYFVAVTIDGPNKAYTMRVFNPITQVWSANAYTGAVALSATDVDWTIGRENRSGSNNFDGKIDELAVFNRILNPLEISNIKNGKFAGAVSFAGFCIDPANGNDLNEGVNWTSPWKTLNTRAFAANDVVMFAKNTETQKQTGATATTGSVSVTGITGWTPAQYNIIRFVGDDTLYMVKAYSSGTITLYRPYRGTTGSKTINLLTLFSVAANTDLTPSIPAGAFGALIYFKGGINTSNNQQDGFTIWDCTSRYGFLGNMSNYATFVDISRIGCYNSQSCNSPGFGWSHINKCFFYRADPQSSFIYRQCYLSTIDELVVEGTSLTFWAQQCTYNNPEVGAAAGIAVILNALERTTVNNLRVCPNAGQHLMQLNGYSMIDTVFNNPNFDELGLSPSTPNLFYHWGNAFAKNLIFRNPKFGAGVSYHNFTGVWPWGDIELHNINGDPKNCVKIFFNFELNNLTGNIWRDDFTYKTAAASARVNLIGNGCLIPEKFLIPCDANVEKTVSIWMMKNSNPLGTVTINTAGSGYAVGDLICVTQTNAAASILRVKTLSGSGVASVEVISGGYGHAVANALNTTTLTGAGSGCKINITALAVGYGNAFLPKMRLIWPTGTGASMVENIYEVTMPDTDNAWQQLSYAVTPSVQGSIVMELVFQSWGTGAICWYDDIGVA